MGCECTVVNIRVTRFFLGGPGVDNEEPAVMAFVPLFLYLSVTHSFIRTATAMLTTNNIAMMTMFRIYVQYEDISID